MNYSTYTREQVEAVLMKDEAAVVRALQGLYARQTADEQQTQDTRHRNGAGFNFNDAPFLTSVAQALPRWRNQVTAKQLSALRKILPKYWRQIGEILGLGEPPVPSLEQVVDAYRAPAEVQAHPNFATFA